MNQKNKVSHTSGRRQCLEFEREKVTKSELPAQRTSGEETDDTAGRTRARCVRLLTAYLGEGGMRMFLRQQQPDLGDCTGAELLETDPEDLLRRFKDHQIKTPREA